MELSVRGKYHRLGTTHRYSLDVGIMHEVLKASRKVEVLLRRNGHNDSVGEGICYKGFDICWDENQMVDVKFGRFCKIGMRTIFGRQMPLGDSFWVQFHFVPRNDRLDPRPRLPWPVKSLRMYLERRGEVARMYLSNGEPTEMVFGPDDDYRIQEWIGFSQIKDGERQWFDLVALCEGVEFGPLRKPR